MYENRREKRVNLVCKLIISQIKTRKSYIVANSFISVKVKYKTLTISQIKMSSHFAIIEAGLGLGIGSKNTGS